MFYTKKKTDFFSSRDGIIYSKRAEKKCENDRPETFAPFPHFGKFVSILISFSHQSTPFGQNQCRKCSNNRSPTSNNKSTIPNTKMQYQIFRNSLIFTIINTHFVSFFCVCFCFSSSMASRPYIYTDRKPAFSYYFLFSFQIQRLVGMHS